MDNFGNSLLSSSLAVEIFRETMPLLITGRLLYLYYTRRITAMETILFAMATEAYMMVSIGLTFNATFFVSAVFLADEIHLLITGNTTIKKRYLLLLLLPLFSNIAVFWVIQWYKDPFYYPPGKKAVFYIRPAYFYIKTLLPPFAVASKIARETARLSFEMFVDTVKKIAKFSIGIAIVQIFILFATRNIYACEIVGLQRRYLEEQMTSKFSLRVQAWFAEPKTFSAFLSLVIPLFMRDREYKWAGLSLLMAILTISSTFWINILIAVVVFSMLTSIINVRAKVLTALGLIIGLFMLITASSTYFIKLYMHNQHNPFYELVFKRSVNRYDSDIWGKDNVVLGMPLQRDMELPAVEFLTDAPFLLITGYGGGNSTFIPPQYYTGMSNYEDHVNGVRTQNLNMRWFYILAEFGLISLVCFFLILTRTKPEATKYQKAYLSFICVCFFFSQIDIFLIITALLCAYETAPEEEHQLVYQLT